MAGHILLAEDDKALSALMQDFFRAAGVTVTPRTMSASRTR